MNTHEQIAQRYPQAQAAAANGSRVAAIRLFCIECHGGEASGARNCQARECFLWPVRPRVWVAAQREKEAAGG